MKRSSIFESLFYGTEDSSLLFEKYSKENAHLHRYMQTMNDEDELEDTDGYQEEEEIDQESKTSSQFSSGKILKRTTWLVHLSDNAEGISEEGFQEGRQDIRYLGLTRYQELSGEPGYNFAFVADSPDAEYAAESGKYGRDAVFFQNSGIVATHFGDSEDQVIFWGPDVDPSDMILAKRVGDRRDDSWIIVGKNGQYVFPRSPDNAVPYKKIVAWIRQNVHQYRRQLFGRR